MFYFTCDRSLTSSFIDHNMDFINSDFGPLSICHAHRSHSAAVTKTGLKPNYVESVMCQTASNHNGYRTLRPPDTSASRHFGTLRHRSQDTSTRVPWSRKSPDTSTQDNSDETQLHGWFVLNFSTNFVVPKCPKESWCRSVLWPKCPAPITTFIWINVCFANDGDEDDNWKYIIWIVIWI